MRPLGKGNRAYAVIYDKIVNGEFPNGCRLPTEIVLAQQLGIGRKTLRTALAELEQQGLLQRVRGQGTFVDYGQTPAPRAISATPCPVSRKIRPKLLIVTEEACPQDFSGKPILIAAEARAKELGIELCPMALEFLRGGDCDSKLEHLKRQNFTGVILNAHTYTGNESELFILAALGVPVLLPFGNDADLVTTPFLVMVQNTRLAVFTGLYYLRRMGHRRIAAFGDALSGAVHGVTTGEIQSIFSDVEPKVALPEKNPEAVAEAVAELWNEPEPPTAILTYNDICASYVIDALWQRGITIPDEVSLISCGGGPGNALLAPALSSVSLLLPERGRMAVDFLVANDCRQAALPFVMGNIIERASVKRMTGGIL